MSSIIKSKGTLAVFSHVHVTLLCTQCFYAAGIPVAGWILLLLYVLIHCKTDLFITSSSFSFLVENMCREGDNQVHALATTTIPPPHAVWLLHHSPILPLPLPCAHLSSPVSAASSDLSWISVDLPWTHTHNIHYNTQCTINKHCSEVQLMVHTIQRLLKFCKK